ncbi:MAG: selenide, water dikinase SelD [Syntrophaceae bacterium]|nr:selenide, water dikinase SelD [Syntrophaceae bacterium]
MGPEDLSRALEGLPVIKDPNLIVGLEGNEDAGVYRLRDDLAIIQTVDFFTPIVDDPYTFGQIAATNSLSDVYAMGGRPITALNIICFPPKKLDMSVLQAILRGGLDKMTEAGVVLVGGHSVEDDEPKYGLSVTGVIHPDRVLRNRGGRPGDKLILTKALGTGIVSTAIKGEEAAPALVEQAVRAMTTLNRTAAELMTQMPVIHACTDVTGFGMLGHACEMIEGSDVGLKINASAVPYFEGVRELVESGYVPGGLYRNKNFRMPMIDVEPSCPDWLLEILFDPQTAGGLLIALPAGDAETLVRRMREAGIRDAAVVGEVIASPKGKIIVR